MATDPGDLVLDPTCVRKGTRVWTPTPTLPVDGEGWGGGAFLHVHGERRCGRTPRPNRIAMAR